MRSRHTDHALLLLIGWFWVASALDHWTTWMCLHEAVPGWVATEANPIAAVLFEKAGLEMGLLIDSIVTVAAAVFLYRVNFIRPWVKISFLVVVTILTAMAVQSNAQGMRAMGIL